jgi:two-component system, chemotaxis family, protein-glutamate methylesterase/glutaminase
VQNKIKVLVVDDSSYVVVHVKRKLESDPDIEVIGFAHNGVEAIEKVKTLHPDVVTLDVVMPEMDGLAALERIMAECPTPVVMLSALTSENAEPTIKALQLGAVDFYLKPSALKPLGGGLTDDGLVTKVKIAAAANIKKKEKFEEIPGTEIISEKPIAGKRDLFNKLVVIGTSTGGPRALMEVVPYLPADIPAAILIVQHMPPVFTRTLAERIAQVSKIEVAEAREGNAVARGKALIAPGDFHMTINEKHNIVLNQDPPNLGVRPSVDNTMESAAGVFGSKVLGVILTGMGMDGTQGAAAIKARGGKVFSQDEATSAVYGMPQSVAKAGCTDNVFPLDKMAREISKACSN